MSRYFSYSQSAKTILAGYKGEQPFAPYIKDYFRQHKKFGSTDRRQISQLCYSFFRLGKCDSFPTVDDRLLSAYFLCTQQPSPLLETLAPDLNEKVALSLQEKVQSLDADIQLKNIFPWHTALSNGIDAEAFSLSHLVQPNLYLRLRPGFEKSVKKELEKNQISFNEISGQCLSLDNAVKIDHLLALDKQAVVQDLSSQRVGEMFKEMGKSITTIWDCCAASGGKSIMAYDLLPGIHLTVSDVRKSILINLEKRFERAGIRRYDSFIADLADENFSLSGKQFDLVICDAPCSGSGTWGRTPEQLYFYQEDKTASYAKLQQSIAATAVKKVKPGGYLLYITCSVFKEENEQVVNHLLSAGEVTLVNQKLFAGYDKRADTLFAALLQKN